MNIFPARFKHGNLVNVNLNDSGLIEGCKIDRVIFTENRVLYDVYTSDTYLRDVASSCLEPAERDIVFENATSSVAYQATTPASYQGNSITEEHV